MHFTTALGLVAAFIGVTSALPATQRRDGGSDNNPSGSNSTSNSNGGIDITNNMGHTIYLWSVGNSANNSMVTLDPGDRYSESWQVNTAGGGISVKMATQPNQSDVLQYEYTLEGDTIYWDLSCINMSDNSTFTTAGFDVSSNNTDCPSANCAPGDSSCAAAYLYPTDDQATHGCHASTQMALNLGSSAPSS